MPEWNVLYILTHFCPQKYIHLPGDGKTAKGIIVHYTSLSTGHQTRADGISWREPVCHAKHKVFEFVFVSLPSARNSTNHWIKRLIKTDPSTTCKIIKCQLYGASSENVYSKPFILQMWCLRLRQTCSRWHMDMVTGKGRWLLTNGWGGRGCDETPENHKPPPPHSPPTQGEIFLKNWLFYHLRRALKMQNYIRSLLSMLSFSICILNYK